MENIFNIILNDLSGINNDISIDVSYKNMKVNSCLDTLLNPEKYGFKKEEQIIFPYDSSINPVSDIVKLIDILQEKEVKTTIEEDVRLVFLINTYGDTKLLNKFLEDKEIYKDILTNDIDITELSNEDLIFKYVYSTRWLEVNIVKPFLYTCADKYMRYVDWINCNYKQTEIMIYINERSILPYLNNNFIDKFHLKSYGNRENITINLKSDLYIDTKMYRKRIIFGTLDSLVMNFKEMNIGELSYLSKNDFISLYLNDKGKYWISVNDPYNTAFL